MSLSEYVYNLFIHLGLPVSALSTLIGFRGRAPWKAVRTKFTPVSPQLPGEGADFWLHGASVGEAELVNRVCRWLTELGVEPGNILVSTQTFSGLEQLEHRHKIVLPFDYPALIRPLSTAVNADWLFVMETELWPNLYRYHDGRTVIFNGRIKDRTFKKYRWISSLLGSTLGHCHSILARSESDAEKFEALASGDVEVTTSGSLKWLQLLDSPPSVEGEGSRFAEPNSVLVAGSTHPGEETLALSVIGELETSVYLAPRHLDRLPEVEELLDQRGLSWCLWSDQNRKFDGDVILVDVLGVLAGLYERGDLAFVGGSWDRSVGGHNLLEPARFGQPIITGPWLQNVESTAQELEDCGLLRRVEEKQRWGQECRKLLDKETVSELSGAQKLKEKAREMKSGYLQGIKEFKRGREE